MTLFVLWMLDGQVVDVDAIDGEDAIAAADVDPQLVELVEELS